MVRYDTSNPPGNERECANYLKSILEEGGINCELIGSSPNRPNLIARLPGQGKAPPLLLQGHMDVVPAPAEGWQHPPFEGAIVGDYMWGRGALDMKSGIAMMVSALLRTKLEGLSPPGDVVLALVADEEAGGDGGTRYLVERHPERFDGVKYAIGEFGGFTFHLGGRRFYPIMVAEKQVCRLRVTARGTSGHGSLFQQDNPMGIMGKFLQMVQTRDLPTHITPVTRMMFQAIGKHLPWASRAGIGALLRPALTGRALRLMGAKGQTFNPLFRNTVNATMLRGGDQVNVVPREVTAELDGRILPGFGPDDLVNEIRAIAGPEVGVDIEVTHFDPGPSTPTMGLFQTLAKLLKEEDDGAVPVPMLMPASTDGRLFAKLGIQTYGFLPMRLPEGFDFADTIHGSGERIPVEAIGFGAKAIYKLLQRFDEGSPGPAENRFSVDG